MRNSAGKSQSPGPRIATGKRRNRSDIDPGFLYAVARRTPRSQKLPVTTSPPAIVAMAPATSRGIAGAGAGYRQHGERLYKSLCWMPRA